MPLRLSARRSKYGAIPRVIDGIRFASTKEANRYLELKLLERAGEITALELQPRFALHAPSRVGTERLLIGSYIADFRFREGPRGILRIEDVKSPATKTAVYRWKKKHVELEYGIEITEV